VPFAGFFVFSQSLQHNPISEPRQILQAFDQDAWAKELDYSQMPLVLSRRIYEAMRADIIHLAAQHYDKSGHLEFIHSETGVRTLREEFDKVAAHNQHHLTQIEMALRQKGKGDHSARQPPNNSFNRSGIQR
jgi:hypothetical protein